MDQRVGRLHVITDETLQDRFSHVELARLAAEGGADTVQFREKRLRTTQALVETARAMAAALEGFPIRLVVDDRVDVAIAAGVPAVHLGPDDLEVALARRLMPAGALIGRTANSLEAARAATTTPADYLGVGPVFGTRSKASPAPTLGVDRLREIAGAVPQPVVAIGSITADRVGDVLETGAWGIAVISAVVCQPDPAAATRAFRRAIDRWLKGRAT